MGDVLERGDIQFIFRPLVQPADADEVVLGVQAFYAILSSDIHRRIRIGKKRMPATSKDRFWARVERVGGLDRVMGGLVESELYSTKTRGERYQPGARPIAHGAYELVRHDDHLHLAYAVEPFGFEDAPDEIQVDSAASHLLLVKNPTGKAVWTHRASPSDLDREKAQLVLVGSSQDPAKQLSVELPVARVIAI
jgi:hypothetical protein